MFLVSITHNSKIRELSDGNRVMVVSNGLLALGPTIFELWVMEIEIWIMEIDEPNTPLVFCHSIFKMFLWAGPFYSCIKKNPVPFFIKKSDTTLPWS